MAPPIPPVHTLELNTASEAYFSFGRLTFNRTTKKNEIIFVDSIFVASKFSPLYTRQKKHSTHTRRIRLPHDIPI